MDSEAFGKLLFLESRYFMPGPCWHDTAGYRDGWNYMIFQGTHAIDLARHVAGEITSVYAKHSVGNDGRFAIACTVTYDGGATGTITLTGCNPNWTCRLEAEGDARAHLQLINLHTLHFETETAESGYQAVPGIPGNYWAPATRDNAEQRGGYSVQMEVFAEAVRTGKAACPTLRDAARAMQICEAILDSIEKRAPVSTSTD